MALEAALVYPERGRRDTPAQPLSKWSVPRGDVSDLATNQDLAAWPSSLFNGDKDLQWQVNSVTLEASAGGGMVIVKMNGQKQIVNIKIEKEIFAGKDQEMLQDLVRAAVNEATRRVDDELANQMKNLAGSIPGMAGLKIPGLF